MNKFTKAGAVTNAIIVKDTAQALFEASYVGAKKAVDGIKATGDPEKWLATFVMDNPKEFGLGRAISKIYEETISTREEAEAESDSEISHKQMYTDAMIAHQMIEVIKRWQELQESE